MNLRLRPIDIARAVEQSKAWVTGLEDEGLVIPTRDAAGRRVYTLDDLRRIQEIAVQRRLRRKAVGVA